MYITGRIIGAALLMGYAISGTLFANEGKYDFITTQNEGMIFDRTNSSALSQAARQGRIGMEVAKTKAGEYKLYLDCAKPVIMEPANLCVIMEYYDHISDAAIKEGGEDIAFCYPGFDKRGNYQKDVMSRIYMAGRDKGMEPYRRPAWRRHFALLPDCALGLRKDTTLTIASTGPLLIRSIELKQIAPETLVALESWTKQCAAFYLRQLKVVIARARAEDLVRQLERIALYAPIAPDKELQEKTQELRQMQEELLCLIRETESLLDKHYYEGGLAIIEEQDSKLQQIQEELTASFSKPETLVKRLRRGAEKTVGRLSRANQGQIPRYMRLSSLDIPEHSWSQNVPAFFREKVRFMGFSGDSPRPEWYPVYSLYGLDAIFLVQGMWNPENTAEGWEANASSLRKNIESPIEHGFNVVIASVHLHNLHVWLYLPPWFAKKYKREEWQDCTYDGDYAPHSYCINIRHEGLRSFMREYVTELGRFCAENPGVKAVNMFDEGSYDLWVAGKCKQLGYCPAARRAFWKDLAQKFTGIEKLNDAWNTSYSSFAEIEPPAPALWDITPRAYAWSEFTRKGLREYAEFLRDSFKQACPDTPVWFESYNYEFNSLADIGHVHNMYTNPGLNIENYNVRRIYRKTIVDAETGGGGFPPGGHVETPAEVLRAGGERNLMDALFWGKRGFDFWSRFFTGNANGYNGKFHDRDAVLVIPSRESSSIAVARDKADRFNKVLLNTEVMPSGVGYVDHGSIAALGTLPTGFTWGSIENLYTAGYYPFCVFPDHILNGVENLSKYKVLYFRSSPVVLSGLNKKIIDWVKNGGLMIADGPWGIMTQEGKRDGSLINEAFGDVEIGFPFTPEMAEEIQLGKQPGRGRSVPEKYRHIFDNPQQQTTFLHGWYVPLKIKSARENVVITMADTEGNPLLMEATLGKGKVIMSTVLLSHFNKYLLKQIARHMPSPARCAEDKPLYTLLREDQAGNRYLCVCNADCEQRITSQIVLSGVYEKVVDLGIADGFPVTAVKGESGTTLPITLAPGEATIFALGK